MKILSIIPACTESRGIPNKNIRIIGDHPLVYYSIRNALNSKYITDVVVSTDSPEVKIIAQQMGVKVHWRDEALCSDAICISLGSTVSIQAIKMGVIAVQLIRKWDMIRI